MTRCWSSSLMRVNNFVPSLVIVSGLSNGIFYVPSHPNVVVVDLDKPLDKQP
jgi:hypothetical protein